MPEDITKQHVEAVSDAYGDVLELENVIAEEQLQYSSWILAIATAGFALTVTQSDKALQDSILGGQIGKWMLTAASVHFVLSAVAGASAKIYINNARRSRRGQLTLLLFQRILLSSFSASISNKDDLYGLIARIANGDFLQRETQRQYKAYEERANVADARAKHMILAQQALVAGGYLIVVIASIG
jgi:hypothetical protein